MRIGIDARWIFPEGAGIEVYTEELLRNLAALDSCSEYVLFFADCGMRDSVMERTGLAGRRAFSTVITPFGLFSPANQVFMPRTIRKLALDVFHSPNYMIPLAAFPPNRRGAAACVVTIHDVIPLLFPDHAPKSRKSRFFGLYRRLMVEVGRRAHFIITDSERSKTDVIARLGIPPHRHAFVRTVYCGVSGEFTPQPRPAAGTGGIRTILYVGRSDPYKNCLVLLDAFADLRKRCKAPVKLRMAGKPDPRYPEIDDRIRSLNLGDSIERGYVPSGSLASVYRDASVLVLPSRYEGFGLPVAEAMACGTPVVCSNAGSLPEVAGDAAIMVDPDDTRTLADAIIKVLENPDMAGEMSAKGIAQAARFTWKRTALETLAVYRDATAMHR